VNALPPPVHIEQVIADRKTMFLTEGTSLPTLTRDLEIDYTALSFVMPQRVQFRRHASRPVTANRLAMKRTSLVYRMQKLRISRPALLRESA
jgi:hypothetical protein